VLKSRNNKAVAQDPLTRFYKSYLETLEKSKQRSVYGSYSCEYVHVGENSRAVPSLKIVMYEYAAITACRPDPLTGSKWAPKWTKVTREQYESLPKVKNEAADAPAPPKAAGARASGVVVAAGDAASGSNGRTQPPSKRSWYGPRSTRQTRRPTSPSGSQGLLHVMIICYHVDLKKVIYFEFRDKPGNFVESSAKFNQIMDSVRSGTRRLLTTRCRPAAIGCG
jgi:hypothetical protein